MQITCPACAKKNDVTSQPGAVCARCSCDLSTLAVILTVASAHLTQAKTELERCNWSAALVQAERSWKLVHSGQCAELACLAAAALGEPDRLDQWRRRNESVQLQKLNA